MPLRRAMICIPNFVKIGLGIQKLIWRVYTDVQTASDLIIIIKIVIILMSM
jgi:hypothetical protein